MRLFLFLFIGLYSLQASAISCDCDIVVFSPMTGSHQQAPTTLKTYELENYASTSVRAQNRCQNSCMEAFSKDMRGERLKSLLHLYTERLIAEKAVGFNCSGLTTLQYPVVVKARLGNRGLGNVYRSLEVITYEEVCFSR